LSFGIDGLKLLYLQKLNDHSFLRIKI